MIEELVSRVFTARNVAHLAHWKTKSFAQHMALGEFYDSIIDQVDALVEAYQGQFGLIGNVPLKAPAKAEIISFLEDELEWLNENCEECTQENESLENLYQNIVASYQSVLYKLKNLS
jgi:DNA-binding ferritin-like protein